MRGWIQDAGGLLATQWVSPTVLSWVVTVDSRGRLDDPLYASVQRRDGPPSGVQPLHSVVVPTSDLIAPRHSFVFVVSVRQILLATPHEAF